MYFFSIVPPRLQDSQDLKKSNFLGSFRPLLQDPQILKKVRKATLTIIGGLL